MSLPDLASQIVYGRLAWATVVATVLLALLDVLPVRRLSQRTLAGLLAVLFALFMLPGAASPAYWLALAFQYPSGLLFGCCVLKLRQHWDGQRGGGTVMMPPLAAAIAVSGAILYLDAMGLLTQGYYYAGFGPTAAPLVALLGAAACAVAIVRNLARPQAGALLTAILLFTLLRLPTGNLWDTLLDPLLWGWAVTSLVTLALARIGQHSRVPGARLPEPVRAADLNTLSPLAPLGAAQQSTTIKEHVSGN
ncbi:hypothetical protein [Pseudoduganella chitinolytica]|uniref:Uncharacterized protein n=1 Tax=Pseudoduganella chitinolytica TaxID=34070 RepID=A0ABY8B4S0_9BURK|nr:hypothetical protein [Pseudoduganella chitinolytica]WEF30947.1 hypothetical protein PX653_15880 [Pseudoduganella chitinolytica]